MAATKITAYSAITQIDPAVDVGVIVDVSDTSMAASGTDKKFTANFLNFAGMAGITGLELVYNAATVIRIRAGIIGVNGKALAFSQTDYTSASTMKDLANATVTLGNNKSYYVFAYDNAGTLNIRFEIADGTGDGSDPIFQAPYYYWTASNTGDAARRIGEFWTDGSGNIIPFEFLNYGRYRRMVLRNQLAVLLVSNGTSSTPASVTLIPYINEDIADYDVFDRAFNSGGATTTHLLFIDGGTDFIEGTFGPTALTGYLYPAQKKFIPNTGALHYQVGASLDNIYLYLCGVGFTV